MFLRFGIVRHVQTEIGLTAARLSGRDFATQQVYRSFVVPIDFRLVYSPFLLDRVNPYAYVGGGGLSWSGMVTPANPAPEVQKSGWAAFIPAGLGLQVRLTDIASLEVSGGYNYTFTDDIELIRSGRKDAFWNMQIGITLISESEDADPDNDGLSNRTEKEIGTNPRKADTDADGLSDGAEVKVHKTNPLKPDTDGDGLADGDEVAKYKTDPLKPDTDDDKLTDGEEITKYLTDPLKADTDGEGLIDSDEIMVYRTDPLKPDTDGDGLADSDEVARYRTNPLSVDTDSGTVGDSVEVGRGTDPLNPTDDVPKIEAKVGKRIVLEGITFKTGRAELTPVSIATLELAYNTLLENPEIEVEISGHTDNTGRRQTNMKLSKARADAVKSYLTARGIESRRIRTAGYGPSRPIAPNTTEEGRALNRRIEFLRTK